MKAKTLTRVIDLPSAGIADRLTIGADGQIQLFDHAGNLITPVTDERSMSYERPKGPKYQSHAVSYGGYSSVSGVEELARFDSLFAIDTNTKQIDGVDVSVAFFLQIKLVLVEEEYRCFACEEFAHAFEFHNASGNPEMLAILLLASANKGRRIDNRNLDIGIITDSDLGNHADFTKQELPIYGGEFLPEGFSLLYASADTGQEFTNSLIRQCNQKSDEILKELAQSPLTRKGFIACPVGFEIDYRYRRFPILERDLGSVARTTINPNSTYTIQFHS